MKFALKNTLLAIVSAVFFAFPLMAFAADSAAPAAANVFVSGVLTRFDAYTVNGNNYFKLRDIAYALSGSAKQFEVTYDAAAGAVLLKSGAPYTAVGGEMSEGFGEPLELSPADVNVRLDGVSVTLRAYNIQGYNYFKLRDVGKLLDFGVNWNAAAKSVTITPDKGYVEENTIFYMKSFGVYSTVSDWPESAELSQNDKYYYLKNDRVHGDNTSCILVESGRHRYAGDDYPAFREAMYRRLLKQAANDPDVGFLFGDGTATARGYTMYIFTVEYDGVERTDRMYYIVGDYKYVLITETDYHDKNAADISAAARVIADSFEWAR
ncbi:MAG: copper amine oxidase N-terminal domain-containing protein [Clostridiales Family XIII bacterium]|jgi:hypothetical protein|nr:copper amine oxidase N-terminal domain-containing protein [Clostridiales Family XIII bacterium]